MACLLSPSATKQFTRRLFSSVAYATSHGTSGQEAVHTGDYRRTQLKVCADDMQQHTPFRIQHNRKVTLPNQIRAYATSRRCRLCRTRVQCISLPFCRNEALCAPPPDQPVLNPSTHRNQRSTAERSGRSDTSGNHPRWPIDPVFQIPTLGLRLTCQTAPPASQPHAARPLDQN